MIESKNLFSESCSGGPIIWLISRPCQPFWIKQAMRCCSRCGIASSERVPPLPLGWYFSNILEFFVMSPPFFENLARCLKLECEMPPAWFAKVYCFQKLCGNCCSHKGCGDVGGISPSYRCCRNVDCWHRKLIQEKYQLCENLGSTVPLIHTENLDSSCATSIDKNPLTIPTVFSLVRYVEKIKDFIFTDKHL